MKHVRACVVASIMLVTLGVGTYGVVPDGLVRAAQLASPQVFQSPESQAASPFLHRPPSEGHQSPRLRSRSGPATSSLPLVPDAWSPKITLRTADGWYPAPIHATLMPNGRVMFFGLEFSAEGDSPLRSARTGGFSFSPAPVGNPDLPQVVVSDLVEPRDYAGVTTGGWAIGDTIICGGQTLTSDGLLFTVGGTRVLINTTTKEQQFYGISYATLSDGQRWWRVPADMRVTAGLGQPWRWYPTSTRLPDARILVTGGFESIAPHLAPNHGAEIFDPSTGSWQVVSPSAASPLEIVNSLYTHTFVLPASRGTHSVLLFGEPGVPVFMTPSEPTRWEVSTQGRPGSEVFQQDRQAHGGVWNTYLAPNLGAASTMLPIRLRDGEWGYGNGSVLVAGGNLGTAHMQYVDVYDPSADAWRPRLDAQLPRVHPSTVLLPDGRVLLVAGASADTTIRQAQYVDPRTGFTLTTGASDAGEVHGYHSVALLLPDGRVLVGGGLPGVEAAAEQPSFRYYSPSYMFEDRPRITSVASDLQVGAPFALEVNGSRPPSEVVLMGLGAMTHSFDMSQRSVQLEVTDVQVRSPGRYALALRGPRDAQTAPPGFYMLFVLDDHRVPSEARIVRLAAAGSPPTLSPTPERSATSLPVATPSAPPAATVTALAPRAVAPADRQRAPRGQ